MPTSYEARPGPEWERAAAALERASHELTQEFENTLSRQAYLMREVARRGILSVPTTGRYSVGIRAAAAEALKVEHDQAPGIGGKLARARIFLDDTMLPADHSKVPELMDRRRGWRHPVFGDQSNWVDQRGKQWFRIRMLRFRRLIREDISHLMSEKAREIDREIF